MKVLIGYDGSDCADAAIDDLKAAGLPPNTMAHVVSIAEVWLPPAPEGVAMMQYISDLQSHEQPFKAWQKNAADVEQAGKLADSAAARLGAMFPKWNVTAEGTYGSPSWELIEMARKRDVDLVVVGSQGRSAIGRFLLGSISQKVLTEAQCSVRVARGKVAVDPSPARIVLGFDGSAGAHAAVEEVATREWPEGSEVQLVAVTDLRSAVTVDQSARIDWIVQDRGWLLNLAADSIIRLRHAGLKVDLEVEEGNPKHVLAEVAERWGANSIFVGANHFGGYMERFLLGSVSAAVAARAFCSVEAVRRRSVSTGD